jgi:hypothetical protein
MLHIPVQPTARIYPRGPAPAVSRPPSMTPVRAHLVQRLVSASRQQTTARVKRQKRIDHRYLLWRRSVVTEELGMKLSGVHSPSLVGGSSRMIARDEGSSIRCVPAGIGIDDRLRSSQETNLKTQEERERFIDGAQLIWIEAPAERPRRCGSTTVVCSTSMRVAFRRG